MTVISNWHFYAFFLLLSHLLCAQTKVYGDEVASSHHVIKVSSLVAKDVCSSSKDSDSSKLHVVQRHGPCSPLKPNKKSTHNQILDQDKLRVSWLHKKANPSNFINLQATTSIPTQQGINLDTANYVITVKFGTPKVAQSLVFDTGSDLTWIQCQPCVSSCYEQEETIFDPRTSSTYSNISCSSSYCQNLDSPSCSGSTCFYLVGYGDNSETQGFFAKDTISLNSKDVIPDFRFGCGVQNKGNFGKVAGLMGLGRQNDSFVQQTYQKYGGVFSYCLPSTSSSIGHLTFGKSTNSSNVVYTRMLTYSTMPSFYFVELISISVNGKKLAILPAIFSNTGSLLDSGTVITRLPPTAYAVLRSAFREGMLKYRKAPTVSILDTCYDLSKYDSVKIPKVALNFRGVSVNLDALGILYVISNKQVCLAFAPNNDDTDLVIIGNTQQKTFGVVHDLSNKMIGFGSKGC